MQYGVVIGFHGGVCWKEIMNSEQTRKKLPKKNGEIYCISNFLEFFLEPH